jgi:nucleoside-diphosphate kinase
MVLEGENVIQRNREIMGATDPAEASAGTIRARWAASKQNNIVHGSDAEETAKFEISYFFSGIEIV